MSTVILKRYITELFQSYSKGTTRNVDPQNILNNGSFIRTQSTERLGRKGPIKLGSDAACAIVIGPRNKFLAVSRKHDPMDFGFPGGHVSEGEDPMTAAMRELREETGIIGKNPAQLASLRNSDGRKVHFYTCEGEGEIDTQEQGIVQWVTPNKLLSGTYGEEARLILHMLGLHI